MTEKTETEIGHVIAAVIERDGKYLVCQRPAHKRHGGLWEFPGGKLETGETLEAAAQRELQEELSLEVTATGALLFATEDRASGLMINFVKVAVTGEPKMFEHSSLVWLEPGALLTVELAPSDRKFVEYLHKSLS